MGRLLVAALALTCSGIAASSSVEGLHPSATLSLSFGGHRQPDLGLSLRLEQPAEIGRALGFLLADRGGDPAATEPARRWMPPLLLWDWRPARGCAVKLSGIALLSDESVPADAARKPMSLTTKLLLGGAAVAAIALVAGSGGGGGDDGGDGYPDCPSCNSDAFHSCDGQVSGVCTGGRLDDDGDCSTTCDTI